MALFIRPSRRSYWNADPWGLDDDMDFLLPTVMNLPRLVSAVRPPAVRQDGNSQFGVKYDKDKFQVMIDVQQFKPEELNVKVADNYLVVEAKHEEKPDEHGYISRQFTRRYMLPEDVKGDAVQCNLSSDGVLMVTAPRQLQLEANERAVPIQQTGTPAITKQKADAQIEQSQAKPAETKG